MRKVKHLFILLMVLCFSLVTHAQDGTNESVVGKFMRSEERSYVVIAVLLAILIGVVLYLVRLDKKISRLEKENKD